MNKWLFLIVFMFAVSCSKMPVGNYEDGWERAKKKRAEREKKQIKILMEMERERNKGRLEGYTCYLHGECIEICERCKLQREIDRLSKARNEE